MEQQTKCYSVNLTKEQCESVKLIKEKSGSAQNKILSEAVGWGLQKHHISFSSQSLFLVKVRINSDLIMELGQKLQTGELDTSMIFFTYCVKDDPTVGVSLWIADDKSDFDRMFAEHKKYYKEIIEIQEAVVPEESMKLILAQMQ